MSMKMCGMDIVQNGGVNEYIVSYIYSKQRQSGHIAKYFPKCTTDYSWVRNMSPLGH